MQGNGRPKGWFWRVRFLLCPLRFALEHLKALELIETIVRSIFQDDGKKGVEFKGGSLHHGFCGSGDLVESTLPSFCWSYKIQGKEARDGFGGQPPFPRS